MYTAFIFPAFVSEYKGDETEILRQLSGDFDRLLEEASRFTGSHLTLFDAGSNDFKDLELESQYISYIFGCATADVLRNGSIEPDYLAGYSMGLYSALYCGGSVSFTGGLSLIRMAFDLIQKELPATKTGMGSIVGLDRSDSEKLIARVNGVTIANTNGKYAFLVSGYRTEILEVLESARQEGALHTSLMNVTCPYHSSLLGKASGDFREFIRNQIRITVSEIPILSGLDQRIFTSGDDIIRELAANLNHPINWMKTMDTMIGLNVSRFIECGAGSSLHKIGRFIEGDFRIYPMDKLENE